MGRLTWAHEDSTSMLRINYPGREPSSHIRDQPAPSGKGRPGSLLLPARLLLFRRGDIALRGGGLDPLVVGARQSGDPAEAFRRHHIAIAVLLLERVADGERGCLVEVPHHGIEAVGAWDLDDPAGRVLDQVAHAEEAAAQCHV